MGKEIRKTRSVCPVCGKNLPAVLVQEPDGVIQLKKKLPVARQLFGPGLAGQAGFRSVASGDGTDAGRLRSGLPVALRHLPGT